MRISFRTAPRSPVFWLSMVGVALFAQNADVQLPGDPGEGERILGVGVKIGEVSARGAVLWTRVPPKGLFNPEKPGSWRRAVRNAMRDDDTQVRYRLGRSPDFADAPWQPWRSAPHDGDYTRNFFLSGLTPGTEYHFQVQGADKDDHPLHQTRTGRFRTAPARNQAQRVVFAVVTGQRYDRRDHPKGFKIYPAMRKLDPDFIVLTGDTVYLDRGGIPALTYRQARFRWRRMYELPWLFDFHAVVPAYWEKDDHDILQDDVHPESNPYGDLEFAEGIKLFRMHTPRAARPFRKARWGSLAEIWFTEVREFRSPNDDPDGPDKSIYGEEQKAWLKSTLIESDAAWRILVNPTPIVGPDRAEGKADNHANQPWKTEGDELRSFFSDELGEEFILIAGDRHWQYHSVQPSTGLHEYGCGPASDAHAKGSPGFDEQYHEFHREAGGFLSVTIDSDGAESTAAVRLHTVNGQVVHEHVRKRPLVQAD